MPEYVLGFHSLSACRRVLQRQGIYVAIGAPSGRWFRPFPRVIRPDLDTMSGLMAAGQVTPVIDRRYGLEQVAEAMRHLETGHARGKVVVIP